MIKQEKHKFIYFLSFIFTYILLNFIPFKLFLNEIPYLVFRLITYFFLMIFVIVYKLRYRIEIPKPIQRPNILLLLPLFIPCFIDIIYAVIFEAEFKIQFSILILVLETIIDLFDSVVEDVIFVDVMITFLYEVLKYQEKKNLYSIIISSTFFMLIRTYVFWTYDFDDAIFNLAVTWVITFACGYLAIYYESEWVPITFHFLFNVPNFVIAPILFDYKTELEYYLFVSIFIIPLLIYTVLMYHLSEKRTHKQGTNKNA